MYDIEIAMSETEGIHAAEMDMNLPMIEEEPIKTADKAEPATAIIEQVKQNVNSSQTISKFIFAHAR